MIEQVVIDAQKVVTGYKANNTNTIERKKVYDPKLKAWFFEKVAVDLNAKKFFEVVKKKEREPKVIPQEQKKKRPRKIPSYESRVKYPADRYFDLLQQGKNPKEIADELGVKKPCVYENLQKYCLLNNLEYKSLNLNTRLGSEAAFPPSVYYELRKQGLMQKEIAAKLGVTDSTVSQNLKKYYEKNKKENVLKRICEVSARVKDIINQCIAESKRFDVTEVMEILNMKRTTIVHHRNKHFTNLDYQTIRMLHPTGKKLKRSVKKKAA